MFPDKDVINEWEKYKKSHGIEIHSPEKNIL